MNPLLAFYYGRHPDDRGRMLAEILRQDDTWLEHTHDFIQWLFPLERPSGVNPSAPLITTAVEQAFRSDASLRDRLRGAFQRMLAFYGLQDDGSRIAPASNWTQRKGNWFTRPTHNDLRITRILRCLFLLGLREEAQRLLACLDRLHRTEPDCGFTPTAMQHWRQAIA